MPTTHLASEWLLLQNQYDSYEKYSLIIKLLSITLLSCAIFFDRVTIVTSVILVVFWCQDAIWKTFQSRIESRLLPIEKFFRDTSKAEIEAFQYNSEYQMNRHRGSALILEYLGHACKPTVAFPHFILLGLALYFTIR